MPNTPRDRLRTLSVPAQTPIYAAALGTKTLSTAARLSGMGRDSHTGATALGSVCPSDQPQSGSEGPFWERRRSSSAPGAQGAGEDASVPRGGSLKILAFQGVEVA